MVRRFATARGYSLTELMTVVSLFAVMIAVAVPATLNVTEALRLGSAARAFERELQAARLKAVQSNRILRVRLNCPREGQYRRVEVMEAAIDTSPTRCSETINPFPSPRDGDPATPSYDGPVRYLPQGVSLSAAIRDLEFRPDGRTFQV